MSWEIILQKFEQQEPSMFDRSQFESIIAPFAEIQEGEFGLELVSKMDDAYEYASLMGEEDGSFSGIMFSRPTNEGPLFDMIFEILSIQGTCIFDANTEFLLGRNISPADIVEDIIDSAEGGLQIINSPQEIIQNL